MISTPVLIGIIVVAGLIAAGAYFLPKSGGAAGKTFGAMADAAKGSPFISKFSELTNTGKNLVGYADLKIASLMVPNIVDAEKKQATEDAFTIILTNVATSKLVAPTNPVTNPTTTLP